MKIEFAPENKVLKVSASGVFNVTDANMKVLTILTTCHMLRLDRLLVDLRDIEGHVSNMAKFLVVTEFERQYLTHFAPYGRQLRIAFLGTEHYVSPDNPMVECIQSHNLHTIQTTSEEDAMAWLLPE